MFFWFVVKVVVECGRCIGSGGVYKKHLLNWAIWWGKFGWEDIVEGVVGMVLCMLIGWLMNDRVVCVGEYCIEYIWMNCI